MMSCCPIGPCVDYVRVATYCGTIIHDARRDSVCILYSTIHCLFSCFLFSRCGFRRRSGRPFCKRGRELEEKRDDFGVILAATLTLLGLIIGFTFSMATNRYDQRKNYEEAEANAIGTEYVRADLLPAADAARVRALLGKYLDQRVLFYTTRDKQRLAQINAAPPNCRPNCGPRSKTLPQRSQHPSLPWPFRA